MARKELITAGAISFFIAIIAYYIPLSFTIAGEKMSATIPHVVAFCQSGLGQFAQLSPEIVRLCSEYNTFMFGIYGAGLIGITLIIVGVLIGKSKRKWTEGCEYCNYIPKSEIDLLDHKAKNHLDKSPYRCEHCDFIGVSEEVLWNHYNEKHPNEKKW